LVARQQEFLTPNWSDRFKTSYAARSPERQRECDRTIMALVKRETSSGLRVKPIVPAKFYLEARLSSGDRVIFRVADQVIYFVDVVSHDDIDRYSRAPKQVR
jgi:hypothetical protein